MGIGSKDFGHPKNEATLDHLNSKLSGERYQVNDGSKVTVLACWKCNNERGSEEVAQLPKRELWQRSGAYPKMDGFNEHVGRVVFSPHSLEKWDERFGFNCRIDDVFAKAIPFGGQLGNKEVLLKYDDVVFVVKTFEEGTRVVKTVLTNDMAMVNMQVHCPQHSNGIRNELVKKPKSPCDKRARDRAQNNSVFAGGLVADADPELMKRVREWKPIADPTKKNPKSSTESKKAIESFVRVLRFCSMTNEQLEIESENSSDTALKGVIKQLINKNNKLKKQTAHAQREEKLRSIYKEVVKFFLPEESMPAFYRMVEEKEIEMGMRNPPESIEDEQTAQSPL